MRKLPLTAAEELLEIIMRRYERASTMARAVGSGGRVFAVDISEGALERLRARVQQEGLTNVTIIKGDSDDPHLGAASLDAVVISCPWLSSPSVSFSISARNNSLCATNSTAVAIRPIWSHASRQSHTCRGCQPGIGHVRSARPEIVSF